MKDNFDKAFTETLKHEGGFVNHPKDPGGMTNLGVTRRVWEDYVEHPVSEAEMRALTPSAVEPLYRRNYWDAVRGDALPSGVDFAMYDFAVNSGPSRAIRYAQKVAGAKQDGVIGPQTIEKIEAFCDEHGAAAFVDAYCAARLAFLQDLATFKTFGKGWKRRVDAVHKYATALSHEVA